ncbi:mannose-6-phosphate isomerase, class I [Corynebacterium sanguinis]|nr:mannose-6-phosphate isomerase, class I [Corynebacterium sanguinis]MCT1463944.1 mannose-6-phosphate isomerase, class I [Corynebacterium sanguinis]MCT1805981.1 mannose-6-phosphate isomerase, class I [Corynebacterium sanguinis]MCT2159434.1 mannose-6-phosphate isomerase, class I [Corynebacterium sanguinis]MCT2330200.1 mannose-6-phosphate isomerase, class I [Corynebacterium sanguinis]MDN8623267.1 mannose-6-phosphate isomerase, class I [Corynebacterium sanguinis]
MALKLTGTMHTYEWGHEELIAGLQGRTPSGQPEAELWFGAHPSAPALTSEGPLDEVIERESGKQLPFLVKLLAAKKPLSLQAHPSREQARAGFARENAAGIPLSASHRNYKDDNHKPELLIALTPFRAVAGFQPIEQTLRLLRAFDLPQLAELERVLDDASLDTAERLSRALKLAMTVDAAESVAQRATELAAGDSECKGTAANLAFIAREYPGDNGVVAALLLNHVSLEPGEALFLAAGNLHAYLCGMGVEVMANSNNVLRGGMTGKHIDTDELFSVLSFVTLDNPTAQLVDGFFNVPVDDFSVAPTSGGQFVAGPAIVINTAGELAVGDVRLGPGEAAWVGAHEGCVPVEGVAAAGFVVR